MNDINGANLQDQPAPAERPAGRRYCDTCVFAQLAMSAGQGVMICRAFGPSVASGVVVVSQGGQNVPRVLSETVWPVVNREDWCSRHELDPRAGAAPRSTSLIASADSAKAS
ncbi:MAG TPA: hypothetical protein VFS52_20765 [Steroidobacteraceae bacterium]|nr:hypothetical protein [Steroidobacteraceae bacterium]